MENNFSVKTVDTNFLLVTIGSNKYTVVKVGFVGARKGHYWKVENVTSKKKTLVWKQQFKTALDAVNSIKYANKEED